MKRSERHHLKDNELAHLATSARDAIEGKGSQVTSILIGVAVVLVLGIGYYAWNTRTENRAHALLADALVLEDAQVGPPPAPGSPNSGGRTFVSAKAKAQEQLTKFKSVADAYPSTDSGLFARYRQGTTYLTLGEAKNAVDAFQQVVDKGGKSLYAEMARMGLAEAQLQAGAFDQAIAAFTDLAQKKDGRMPVDGVLARLAQTYLAAGKKDDAQKTFTRLVDEFPDSPFSADARRTLEEMKKG